MAEVLPVTQHGRSFASGLKRTGSQPSLLLDSHSSSPSSSPDKSDYKSAYRLHVSRSSTSQPSSAPSSPRFSHADFSTTTSYLSTPPSSLSFDDDDNDEDDDCDCTSPADYASSVVDEDDLKFPSYDGGVAPQRADYYLVDPDETLSELSAGGAKARMSSESKTSTPQSKLSRSNSVNLNSIADDTAIKPQPTRHVDYLSHDWKLEEIWSSWRHIVGHRGSLENSERLENASWRTWVKAQRRLSTINPDRLNWMKDHDVTWLYGPLQTGAAHILREETSHRSSFSRSNSFLGKKPILKRRSVSEIMLQRSLSTQSLMRQATDSIRAQEVTKRSTRPDVGERTYSDYVPTSSPSNSSNQTIPESPCALTSSASSGSETPDDGRHIHFNETVEQCIAITSDSDVPDGEESVLDDEEHSSDDEFLTMKTDRTLERKLSRSGTPRNSFSEAGGKTIQMLPATTLKYRSDTPEIVPQDDQTPIGSPNGTLHQSSSQETLRPSRSSSNFLLDCDEEQEDVEQREDGMDPAWHSAKPHRPPTRRDSLGVQHNRYNGDHRTQLGLDLYRDDNDELQHRNMRRTPSGMFMPYDDDNELSAADGAGLVGRVVDTYNTARDIAHVIWNVGWRR